MMKTVTLIYGDGIGKEVIAAAKAVVEATGADIAWEIQEAGAEAAEKYGQPIDDKVIESIAKNGVALKGPTATPIGKGFRSVNVEIRKRLDLYVNLRPLRSFQGVDCLYPDLNLTIVRENTEGLYTGIEQQVTPDHAEATKIITRGASERIVEYAFQYAQKMGKKKVTAIHKANIMKLTDGLFLNCAKEVAAKYNDIQFNDKIIDAACMDLVLNPASYDVLVAPNLYGDILSDLASALVGGLGVAPGANIGKNAAVFEAVHGSAPDIAGKDLANPTSAILSAAMMLKHLGYSQAGEKVEAAVAQAFAHGEKTVDLGGNLGCKAFTEAVIKYI
ncbi:MAG: isocitrate/isopropylmalate dehydrogenase family protein [Peptococcaceae bacterium]|nr:isocitrate/isopropylmalate dehydrogenase family protein [Peptococcaceae bacterium]